MDSDKTKEPVKVIHRPLRAIARDIRNKWKTLGSAGYAAKPYVDAMACGEHITDIYINGDYRTVVTGFLANAQYWRGNDAFQIKAELKDILNRQYGARV